MGSDWSSFTPERLERLPAYDPDRAPGYLVWAKMDYACLMRPDLGALLEQEPLHDGQVPEAPLIRAAKDRMLRAADTLARRSIRHVCLGVSWCDWHCMPGARAWIGWYLRLFAERFEVLPRLTFTPPTLTDSGTINRPPKEPLRYAEFLGEFLGTHGHLLGEHVELWNEWNIDTDWERDRDPEFRTFMVMIAAAALVAHRHGKKAVLGGMTGITDDNIRDLAHFARSGLFRYVDVAGFHDLRGTWSDDVPSAPLPDQVRYVRGTLGTPPTEHGRLASALAAEIEKAPARVREVLVSEQFRLRSPKDAPAVWLTEYGFPVVDPEGRFPQEYLEDIQVALFAYAADCVRSGALERAYWYTYQDFVGESVRAHTTGWEDVLQYYYGDTCEQGTCRKLGQILDEGGPDLVLRHALERGLFPLVDAASLGRTKPDSYKSNCQPARKT